MPERLFSLVHLLILLFFFLILVGILLLLVLRLATWLLRRFPRRPGQRVSVAGVLMGGITDVFASGVLGVPVVIYIQTKGSAAIAFAINSGGWLYWLQLAIEVGCSALGGYVAAWIAKHDELLNGLLSSFLWIAVGFYSILLGKGTQSLLAQILLLVAAPGFWFLWRILATDTKADQRYTGHSGARRVKDVDRRFHSESPRQGFEFNRDFSPNPPSDIPSMPVRHSSYLFTGVKSRA